MASKEVGGGGEGNEVRDMAPPSLENLGMTLILRPILHKSVIVIFSQQFKMSDSNDFTLSLMFSFQNEWSKAVFML